MSFPISVKFTRNLGKKINQDDYPRIFEVIKGYLINKKAFDVEIKNNLLRFRAGFDRSDFHLVLVTIDGGIFAILQNTEHTMLTYEIFLCDLLYVLGLLSLAIGIGSKSWLFGLLIFFMLYGFNLLILIVNNIYRVNKILKRLRVLP